MSATMSLVARPARADGTATATLLHPSGVRPLRDNALGPGDILDADDYLRVRADYLRLMAGFKRRRRIRLAPHVGLLFENRETVLLQIHEILRVEGHSPAHIRTQLEHYACLVPPPGELRATAMVDGGSPAQGRELAAALRRPGAVRLSVAGDFCGSELAQTLDSDEHDAVQYLRFRPPPEVTRCLRQPTAGVVLSLEWNHRVLVTAVGPGLRDQLVQDLTAAPAASLLRALDGCSVVSSSRRSRVSWPF